MDLWVIRGVVEELKKEIVGGFLAKIYQMNRTDLLLRLRGAGEERDLLLSAHPDFSRLHLTEKKYANPPVPPRFCAYLRKHTLGARVAGVSQDPCDRVVRLFLQRRMDAGAVRNLALVAELTGKNSNLLLLEGEKILDCLHFRREEEGGGRPALPGMVYIPPSPPGGNAPPGTGREALEEVFLSPPGERWRALARKVPGLSPLLAREVEFAGGGTLPGLEQSLQSFLDRYERADFSPRVLTLLGEKKVLSPFPLPSLGPAEEQAYPSMNRAADAYYFEVAGRRQMAGLKQGMGKRLRQLLSRLLRRKENLSSDREGFEKELEFKAYGDLLTANYPRLKKGMGEVEVQDFRQDPPRPVLIPLEEALDPPGNVQRYYKRYKKAKRGLEMVSSRIRETEEETAYLESVLFQLEEAEDSEELEAIRAELEEERILPLSPKRGAAREKAEKSPPVRRFRSSEGLEIFCGKHNVGNDYLLRQLARDNDLWFHSQGVPGSHVLLKAGRAEPGFKSIQEAAAVAAYYSSGRGSGRLPVDYTPARNVRRPKGAKPGMVTYYHQKTLMARPEKEIVEKLKI